MKFHSTVLFVKDITKSKDFYTRILNFEIEQDYCKNVTLSNGLSLWEIPSDHMINSLTDKEKASNQFELYFEAENLIDIAAILEQDGIKFLHGIKEEPWGQKTFRFFDPDNNLIEIGESMDVFVNNMHNRGLTPAQISSRSGIPIEKVVGLIWK